MMGDLVTIGPPIGSFINVSRHGERLWLRVKSIRPKNRIVAVIANQPVIWPHSIGDAVEISYDEVLDWKEKP